MSAAGFGELRPYFICDFAFETGQVFTWTKFVKEGVGVSE